MRELARLLGMTPGFVTNWERGLRLPKPEDVGAVLAHCRVIGEDRRRIVEMARGAREQDWIATGGEAAYREWERTARRVFAWGPELVPPLLQTSGYARAVCPTPRAAEEERPEWREVRGRCVLVVGETALRRRIGGAEVMAEQVRHLSALLEGEEADVRVVPAEQEYQPGLGRAFTIFDFASLPSIVHERLLSESASSSSPARVARYREVAETLLGLALPRWSASALLESVLRELSVPGGSMGKVTRGEV
ncbi:helix-turn-helix transcriptional regulator [Amycolatopsis ultiminotia]|uniref:Helix-turn-helix transcriptional regulator n=1 Tax=Amycolatopsis ultiminotia TaxID=543629 RepID=A0ABP6X2X0_9PSEU